jgi:thiamine biosynthesis lipoprotein
MRNVLLFALLVVGGARAAIAAPAAGAAPTPAPTTKLDGTAFGLPLHLEALAGRGAEAALRAAADAVARAEAASDTAGGPLAALNGAAGAGPHKVPPSLIGTLSRALTFCRWSGGAHGPLGGRLYELWGLRTARTAMPTPADLEQATASAACDRLVLDAAQGTATLNAAARVDLWGFAAGAALDEAVAALAAHGVRNASVTLGPVQRAVGSGPGGRGWPLRVAVPAVLDGFTRNVWLQDQAFAFASRADGALRAGGETHPPYLDQRLGRPIGGVLATVAIAELALDAQGVAGTLFTTGSRRGSLLLGQLKPPPAALWVLGDGNAPPLVTDYRWGTRQRRSGG